jgi:hypothetical protein
MNYVPELTSIGSYNGDNREFDSRAAPYAIQMIEAASNDGISLDITPDVKRNAAEKIERARLKEKRLVKP